MNYRRIFIKNSLIFLTLVTNHRIPLLVQNISILKKAFFSTIKIYKYKTIAFVVQPDHIHCIIKPKNITDYPKIIKSFKYSFTKNVGLVKPTYKKVWQNRYWEHTIRDEDDLYKHINYIHYNPVKHNTTTILKDWQFSSFSKFLKRGYYETSWEDISNINTNKDIENIKNWNFE